MSDDVSLPGDWRSQPGKQAKHLWAPGHDAYTSRPGCEARITHAGAPFVRRQVELVHCVSDASSVCVCVLTGFPRVQSR